MTLIQIAAFLSVLSAFQIPQATIDQIRDVLIPPVVSQAPVAYVPVIQSPIVENQPVYFGSAPVNNPQPVQEQVVQLVPMTPLQVDISISHQAQRNPPPADIGAPEGFYLAISSNKPLDLSKTVFPQGITSSLTSYDAKVGNTQPVSYYSELKLEGYENQPVAFTLYDLDGQSVTKSRE